MRVLVLGASGVCGSVAVRPDKFLKALKLEGIRIEEEVRVRGEL